MPQMGFEPTISVFERAKAVHALERAATVIGRCDLEPKPDSLFPEVAAFIFVVKGKNI
jgi:hypothetical protein